MAERLAIVAQDEWLHPVENEMVKRHSAYLNRRAKIIDKSGSLENFASAHHFFGWQRDEMLQGWHFREWLPRAKEVYIFGEFNDWQRTELALHKSDNGIWSIFLPDAIYKGNLNHLSLYKLHIHGANGWRDRIPAYATRAIQDNDTKNFTAQFYIPRPFDWGDDKMFRPSFEDEGIIIYEAHIGMAQESAKISSYREFTQNILPKIKAGGYNTVQLMAIAEHPYYGSFGYHVSNFFAASSRFGTPEELKELVREAHKMGIAVVMDIVHAHFVRNINEGLNELDGDVDLYSQPGERGYQKHWDSMVFDYKKEEVQRFLLSNLRYWIEEFHIDGYRFDGVSSMIYHHRGHADFSLRESYFNEDVDTDALTYLTLANELVHTLKPHAITIAEDVSGMPALCSPIEDGGVGFDYRLSMYLPDLWINLLDNISDDKWSMQQIWDALTSRLPSVKSIAYAESHDQAMVGDKTIAFRLMDSEMYTHMDRGMPSVVIDRGMALHKMIRLITISAGGEGYLNFMGNEFGHPEWIDFPREGNNWSFDYAQRKWSLAENNFLRYSQLLDFDRAMVHLIKEEKILCNGFPQLQHLDEESKTIAYTVGNLLFVFNYHSELSTPDYKIKVALQGSYTPVICSDEKKFGGFDRVNMVGKHLSFDEVNGKTTEHFIKIYNSSRTATIYKLNRV